MAIDRVKKTRKVYTEQDWKNLSLGFVVGSRELNSSSHPMVGVENTIHLHDKVAGRSDRTTLLVTS